jgi:hypothetical protein
VRFGFEISPSCDFIFRCHLRAITNPAEFLILCEVLALGGFLLEVVETSTCVVNYVYIFKKNQQR